MYNHTQVRDAFLTEIGWKQQMDEDLAQLMELTTSASGRYYQGFHALLGLGVIASIAPNFDLMTIEQWDNSTTYPLDHLVEDSGKYYRSLQASNTNNLTSDTSWWVETNLFTNWVRQKTIEGIYAGIDAWLVKKFGRQTMGNLLEFDTLFKSAGSLGDLITKQSKRVGMVILPNRSLNLSTTLREIGVQLNTNQTLTLKLFKSDTIAAKQTVAVNYTGGGGVQWEEVNWSLDPDGAYYLVYDEDLLTGQAINGLSDYNFYTETGAQAGSLIHYYPTGRYFDVASFSTSESYAQLWDVKKNTHTLSHNYGLNLKMTVECDYTNFIIKNKSMFVQLIGNSVALQFLTEEAINASVQINRLQKNAQMHAGMILRELDGSEENPGGIRKKFEDTLEMLSFDMVGLDPDCMPCKKNGVRLKTFR